MNLAGLESALYDRLGYEAAPPTATIRKLRSYLNESHREVLGRKGMSQLRRTVLTFSSVASDPFAVMPRAVTRIVSVMDRVNNWELRQVPLASLRFLDPGLVGLASYPDRFSILNLSAATVLDPPAIGAELFFKSDSVTDGATKTVTVEGVLANGHYRAASVNLNGTTAVSLGATITTWMRVTKFFISLAAGGSTSAAGNITLHQTSGAGTELSRIGIGGAYARYSRIHFYPTPTAVNTYYADVELHVEEMSLAGDEPLMPEDFHRVLIDGALRLEFQKRRQSTEYVQARQRFEDGVGDLQITLKREAFGSSARRDFSQLGSMFPAGT